MTYADMIAGLKYCGEGEGKYCRLCPAYDTCHATVDGHKQILLAAADLIEAQAKALDECAKQLADTAAKVPKEGEWIKNDKLILDATCGNRGIWFQKHEPHTVYCDKRTAHYEMDFGDKYPGHRTIDVAPDIEGDFTNLPFEDGAFNLVVIDPPHLLKKDGSWLKKHYGCYETKEEALESVAKGIRECMRVLRTGGVLVFKWNELDISTREIIDACGYEPLFGHRSGKKANTHWMCFMKFEDEVKIVNEKS